MSNGKIVFCGLVHGKQKQRKTSQVSIVSTMCYGTHSMCINIIIYALGWLDFRDNSPKFQNIPLKIGRKEGFLKGKKYMTFYSTQDDIRILIKWYIPIWKKNRWKQNCSWIFVEKKGSLASVVRGINYQLTSMQYEFIFEADKQRWTYCDKI